MTTLEITLLTILIVWLFISIANRNGKVAPAPPKPKVDEETLRFLYRRLISVEEVGAYLQNRVTLEYLQARAATRERQEVTAANSEQLALEAIAKNEHLKPFNPHRAMVSVWLKHNHITLEQFAAFEEGTATFDELKAYITRKVQVPDEDPAEIKAKEQMFSRVSSWLAIDQIHQDFYFKYLNKEMGFDQLDRMAARAMVPVPLLSTDQLWENLLLGWLEQGLLTELDLMEYGRNHSILPMLAQKAAEAAKPSLKVKGDKFNKLVEKGKWQYAGGDRFISPDSNSKNFEELWFLANAEDLREGKA